METRLTHEERAEERTLDRLIRGGALYALVDACDMPAVYHHAAAAGTDSAVSLYKGLANEEDVCIGAFLFRVTWPDIRWIRDELPEDSWGVLVVSEAPLTDLLKHFQQYVTVQAPDGSDAFFRFYDPRVLPLYLDHASSEEASAFFGPVTRFGIMNLTQPVSWIALRSQE